MEVNLRVATFYPVSCFIDINGVMCTCNIVLIVCGHGQHDGKVVAMLAITGSSGYVKVNGSVICYKSSVDLTSGDEVEIFSSGNQPKNHSYVSFELFHLCSLC